jgi:hypothetical protein
MKKKMLTCVFVLLLAALLLTPFLVLAQTSGEYISLEEFEERLAEAVDLSETKCSLPIPTVEGSPIAMKTYDDWTRQAVCIANNGVEGIGWSAWPGALTYPTQHYVSWWRLVDSQTLRIIKEVKIDTINNPIISGPPKSPFDWLDYCGPGKDLLLLLDISARQIVNGVEVGLENRDHSWHFSIPDSKCMVYLPIIKKQIPPPPTCPLDWKLRVVSPNDGDDLLPYTIEGATVNFVYQMTPGQIIRFYIEKDGVQTRLVNGETTVYGPDKTIEFGDASYIELVGGEDLGFYTYTLESGFVTPEGVRCWNYVKIYDPPALLASQLIAKDPDLSWDEAYEMAIEILKNK